MHAICNMINSYRYLTFQKVKKGLTDNIAEEQEGTSGEEDIVHEDDVFT